MEAATTSSPTDFRADDGDTLGGRIVRAREAIGLSTAQLARRLGVKTSTLSQWENDRAEPRANRLNMLAGILGVSPMWLLIGRGVAPADEDPMAQEAAMLRTEIAHLSSEALLLSRRLSEAAERLGRLHDSASRNE
ncbi:transcriptional regulator with XRE-family HTH domain [Rhodopseudomonas julia]|uniref:Transcriptional regulator with XRE-family HTH domain n=1 Tax=Rhodopseudomonas julia TaxID=200617 RepID=A0ABU0C4I1_9BRAD|nr:helix-turn-helix domain-containing protein [Rhodopseudomonas julia]MDQ0324864.1 transcriptional regulator with XRE-family HTH domain [Rhodopseudomonas julia]